MQDLTKIDKMLLGGWQADSGRGSGTERSFHAFRRRRRRINHHVGAEGGHEVVGQVSCLLKMS